MKSWWLATYQHFESTVHTRVVHTDSWLPPFAAVIPVNCGLCSEGTVLMLLIDSKCRIKCHEEVLYLQPMIPPKRFDIFPPDWGILERSTCVQIFV